MATRFSLPGRSRDADSDTARLARTLAALVFVLTVMVLALGATLPPADQPALAAAPDDVSVASTPAPGS